MERNRCEGKRGEAQASRALYKALPLLGRKRLKTRVNKGYLFLRVIGVNPSATMFSSLSPTLDLAQAESGRLSGSHRFTTIDGKWARAVGVLA